MGDTLLTIIIFAIYAIFIGIMMLIAIIPSVINAIGLARICKKLVYLSLFGVGRGRCSFPRLPFCVRVMRQASAKSCFAKKCLRTV